MDKKRLVELLIIEVRSLYERALKALAGATEAATGDDTKAESKYDTRGLEASYLAAGQAEQADELAASLAQLEAFNFADFEFDDEIGPGALVECERDGEIVYFLLAPAGGGITLKAERSEVVTVLGPSAPLRQQLIGRRSGESVPEASLSILELF